MHHGYHDGWTLKGMKEELKSLEDEIKNATHRSRQME